MELSERREQILSAVIERFIATGEPVGSKFLTSVLLSHVSSATIRNEMAYLSEIGLLSQPHTSAGRVPSDLGYRYYIDKLVTSCAPSDADVFRMMTSIDSTEGDPAEILSGACEALSSVTGLAAIATVPYSGSAVVKNADAAPIGKRTVLVSVTTSVGVFKSKLAKMPSDIDYGIIELFYNIAAAHFIGKRADEYSLAGLQDIVISLGSEALMLSPLLVTLYETVQQAFAPAAVGRGYERLVNQRNEIPGALEIIELIRDEQAVGRLMSLSGASPVEISIGRENGFRCLENAAVIKAGYEVGESGGGVIAVIGPTKTDYTRIIPSVKYMSTLVGQYLANAAAEE